MKREEMTFSVRVSRDIDALALAIAQGQAKLDAYMREQNNPRLVARRWLKMQLIRLFN